MRSQLILATLLVLLTGCSSAGKAPAQMRPLAPLLPGDSRQLVQHIAVQYRGEQKDLMGASLLGPELVKISLLTPEGVGLLDIRYDGREVRAEQYLGGKSIPPEALLADMQLVYWPLQSLRDALPAQWNLREKRDGDKHRRQLFFRGELFTEVTYSSDDIWRARVQLDQKVLGYSLNIKNL